MPTVAIPAEHFTKSVKRNYSDHKSALIRELVQNSVDAGSSNLWIDIDESEKTLTFTDDGCGMTKEILVKAMLTMSGSYKANTNPVGGFGAAKEILIFQHQQYSIITRHGDEVTAVVGHQLDYEFVEGNLDHQGTMIKIWFHEDFGFDSIYTSYVVNYLCDCELDQDIWLNGEQFTIQKKKGELLKENDWCKIYVKEHQHDVNTATIRISGVKMFDVWVNTKYEVIVEITKPSIEILTVNRDGFNWRYQEQLIKLIFEISVDKGQFGKMYGKSEVWRGVNKSYDDIAFDASAIVELTDPKFKEYEEKMSQMAMEASNVARANSGLGKAEMVKVVKDTVEKMAVANDLPDQLITSMINAINDQVCDHVADFHIEVSGKNINKIPDKFLPNKWSNRTTSIVKLWKHCIKLVMKANGIVAPYTIGFIIDNDEKTFACHKMINGVSIFMINPMLTWMQSSVHMNVFHKMILMAAHECTHREHQFHNESFNNCCEDYIHRTLCMINKGKNSWWKEYLNSKNERI
jgi:hypothetical protein